MDIVQVVLFGIVASIIYIVLKDVQPSFAFLILFMASIVILAVVVKQLHIIIQLLRTLSEKAAINSFYFETILKIIGIAYITELGASITKDAGLSSIATKIEITGKIFILLLAIPIIHAVVEMVLQFIPVSDQTFLP